ncbi:Uncharacterized protein ToN1_18840 [Aromatoleum petrolei]|nr:Uncharacterized protein ToN1_18840 [Aromatoleum petrolei]
MPRPRHSRTRLQRCNLRVSIASPAPPHHRLQTFHPSGYSVRCADRRPTSQNCSPP